LVFNRSFITPELTMIVLLRMRWVWLLAVLLAAAAPAQDLPRVQPPALVSFASEEGLARLARASAKADFATLANQFEAQSNAAFCGPTTAAIVLNALAGTAKDLPRDRSRLRSEDLLHLPATADLTLPRYTQDNVFDKSPKTRAQVLGEPIVSEGKSLRDVGFQLRQFDALLQAHGLATRMVIVGASVAEAEVRADLRRNLERSGDYVIVNYTRRAVGQAGGGHISPLGAYDAASDSFLVLDVNPAAAGWVWMPTVTLVQAMRSFDTVENRGYIVIGPR
jgi:Phytochelatin synthase